MSFGTPVQPAGWFETLSDGLATIRLSITDEGIVTVSTDTPANAVFMSRILNPEQFYVSYAPVIWPWQQTSMQLASYAQMDLDNSDGALSFLTTADLRDTVVTIQLTPRQALGSATMLRDALVVATVNIDTVTANGDTITLSFKDTLARLDRPLRVKFNPQFVDAGAVGQMIPLTFGSCRNVAPLLIDSPNRIFQIHDGPIPNVLAVKDMAAPLDINATPPQYTPFNNASCIQLETMPDGKLTVDCSSYGTQAPLPGIPDVLGGIGTFSGWTGMPSLPTGWTWSNTTHSAILDAHLQGFPTGFAYLLSANTWDPNHGATGDYMSLTGGAILQPGMTYRASFQIARTFADMPYFLGGLLGGLMLRTDLTANASGAVTPNNQPLTVPLSGMDQTFNFEFTVPAGSARNLYVIACDSAGSAPGDANYHGGGGGIIGNIKIEQVGQFIEQPTTPMPLTNYFTEILVYRAQESPDIFSSSDTDAMWASTAGTTADGTDLGYNFGKHYTSPPNIVQSLLDVTDSFTAAIFTDSLGVIRVKAIIDPKLGTPIADFIVDVNAVRGSFQFASDEAQMLTTLVGVRRNQSPFGSSDFVSDQALVPQDTKTRYSRDYQYQRSATVTPASHYANAIGAPQFASTLDDTDQGQHCINAAVGLYAPRIYPDGTFTSGKRTFVTFDGLFDDPLRVGATITCSITDILFGTVVLLTNEQYGFSQTPVTVVGWKPYPIGGKITLIGWY